MAEPSKAVIPFLIAMMLITGVCNTLLTKYQDLQCVRHCDSTDPKHRILFEQPVVQTAQMFVGEAGCWLVIGAFALWKRLASRNAETALGRGEYAPVDGAPEDGVDVEGDTDVTPVHSVVLVPKPIVHLEAPRLPLKGWRVVLLALPACCDIGGTTLMNVGLLFVAASIYQMTRGALVLFVGLFSALFLHRKLHLYQWASLCIVVIGVGIVGLAGYVANSAPEAPSTLDELKSATLLSIREAQVAVATPEAVRTIVGVLLIAGAQVFTATQFVVEEWILERYELQPIRVVGWEGVFGFLVTMVGMIVLHLAVGRTDQGQYGYFDAREGWRELTQYPSIAVSSVLIMISIGGFNFFGLSVTRSVSATSRSTIDTCRTLFIWIVSLGLGWETFKALQILGFALLVYGTFLFNGVIRPPMMRCLGVRGRGGWVRDAGFSEEDSRAED